MIIGSFVGSFDYTLVTPIQKKIDCTDKPLLLVKMNEAYDSDFSTESAKLGQELMDGRIKDNSKAKYKKAYLHFVNYAMSYCYYLIPRISLLDWLRFYRGRAAIDLTLNMT